eukprot:7083423-Prymnesium_polylepis.1
MCPLRGGGGRDSRKPASLGSTAASSSFHAGSMRRWPPLRAAGISRASGRVGGHVPSWAKQYTHSISVEA